MNQQGNKLICLEKDCFFSDKCQNPQHKKQQIDIPNGQTENLQKTLDLAKKIKVYHDHYTQQFEGVQKYWNSKFHDQQFKAGFSKNGIQKANMHQFITQLQENRPHHNLLSQHYQTQLILQADVLEHGQFIKQSKLNDRQSRFKIINHYPDSKFQSFPVIFEQSELQQLSIYEFQFTVKKNEFPDIDHSELGNQSLLGVMILQSEEEKKKYLAEFKEMFTNPQFSNKGDRIFKIPGTQFYWSSYLKDTMKVHLKGLYNSAREYDYNTFYIIINRLQNRVTLSCGSANQTTSLIDKSQNQEAHNNGSLDKNKSLPNTYVCVPFLCLNELGSEVLVTLH